MSSAAVAIEATCSRETSYRQREQVRKLAYHQTCWVAMANFGYQFGRIRGGRVELLSPTAIMLEQCRYAAGSMLV